MTAYLHLTFARDQLNRKTKVSEDYYLGDFCYLFGLSRFLSQSSIYSLLTAH